MANETTELYHSESTVLRARSQTGYGINDLSSFSQWYPDLTDVEHSDGSPCPPSLTSILCVSDATAPRSTGVASRLKSVHRAFHDPSLRLLGHSSQQACPSVTSGAMQHVSPNSQPEVLYLNYL